MAAENGSDGGGGGHRPPTTLLLLLRPPQVYESPTLRSPSTLQFAVLFPLCLLLLLLIVEHQKQQQQSSSVFTREQYRPPNFLFFPSLFADCRSNSAATQQLRSFGSFLPPFPNVVVVVVVAVVLVVVLVFTRRRRSTHYST